MSGYLGWSSKWQRLHPKWKINSSSHYLQSFFIHPRWWSPDFWRINNMLISWRATTTYCYSYPYTVLQYLAGGWTNPFENICSSKWVHLPQFSGWKFKKKYVSFSTASRKRKNIFETTKSFPFKIPEIFPDIPQKNRKLLIGKYLAQILVHLGFQTFPPSNQITYENPRESPGNLRHMATHPPRHLSSLRGGHGQQGRGEGLNRLKMYTQWKVTYPPEI